MPGSSPTIYDLCDPSLTKAIVLPCPAAYGRLIRMCSCDVNIRLLSTYQFTPRSACFCYRETSLETLLRVVSAPFIELSTRIEGRLPGTCVTICLCLTAMLYASLIDFGRVALCETTASPASETPRMGSCFRPPSHQSDELGLAPSSNTAE